MNLTIAKFLLAGERLSERQVECLELIAQGDTQLEAGRKLGVDHDTVRAHLFAAKRKLGGKTTVHAVVLALQLGLLNVDTLDKQRVVDAAPQSTIGRYRPLRPPRARARFDE